MTTLFDYGNVNDDHKAAAEECAQMVEQSNPALAALIRLQFKIVQAPRIPLEGSEFYKVATEFGLGVSPQGYMKNPDGVEIPMVLLCSDITKLDEFYNKIKNS